MPTTGYKLVAADYTGGWFSGYVVAERLVFAVGTVVEDPRGTWCVGPGSRSADRNTLITFTSQRREPRPTSLRAAMPVPMRMVELRWEDEDAWPPGQAGCHPRLLRDFGTYRVGRVLVVGEVDPEELRRIAPHVVGEDAQRAERHAERELRKAERVEERVARTAAPAETESSL